MSEDPSKSFSRVYGNPAYPEYLADPFVFRIGDDFYAIGTGHAERRDPSGKVFHMLRSKDFVTWRSVGPALEPPDSGLGTDFWAPEIAQRDGYFFLYYSVGFEDRAHQIRVAIAEDPLGPYKDVGDPVLASNSCSFAIDPSPFQDSNGAWYLFYARDLLDGSRPGTSLVMAPLDDMRRIPHDYTVVARASADWQRFKRDRVMYGAVYDWHTLEGPCMITHEGRYYCLYSGGNWQNESYGLDYVSSDKVTGPFIDDHPSGPRLLKTVPRRVIGPGHNSVVLGPNNITQYIAYHAWDAQKVARRMCFDVLDWTPDGPRCQGPTWEPKVVDW